MSERKNWPTSRTVSKLEKIPMLAGLIGVTLYGLPILHKAQVHGTAACYSHGGCRCDACKLANADRIRAWSLASGRTKRTYAAADARRDRSC